MERPPPTLPPQRDRPLAGGLTVIAQDLDDDLFNVMAQMPEEVRCCLLLRVIDGLSYAEISETMAIPEGTASSHVHRGKSFMRSRLSRSHNVGKQL